MSIKEYRVNIGVEIIEAMQDNEDLPLPNRYRLSKTMQEYFVSMGYAEQVLEAGYKWQPDDEYWRYCLSSIQEELRKRGKFFAFVRAENGQLKGEWMFCSKSEFIRALEWDHKDISTRTDHHNETLTDAQGKWKIELPHIAKVPALTN